MLLQKKNNNNKIIITSKTIIIKCICLSGKAPKTARYLVHHCEGLGTLDLERHTSTVWLWGEGGAKNRNLRNKGVGGRGWLRGEVDEKIVIYKFRFIKIVLMIYILYFDKPDSTHSFPLKSTHSFLRAAAIRDNLMLSEVSARAHLLTTMQI